MFKERTLKFLEVTGGRIPFFEWYESVKDEKLRIAVAGRLRQLQNYSFKNFKSVGAQIFELKIFLGPGYRIYFAFESDVIVVILAGGDKSTQKQDILYSAKIWRQYLNETR